MDLLLTDAADVVGSTTPPAARADGIASKAYMVFMSCCFLYVTVHYSCMFVNHNVSQQLGSFPDSAGAVWLFLCQMSSTVCLHL